ncbi:hypothetical protein ACWEBX_40990, partial [Streptomyces sp. NPDC005070]
GPCRTRRGPPPGARRTRIASIGRSRGGSRIARESPCFIGRADRLFALRWLRYGSSPRVVHVTEAGADGLADTFGLRLAD